MLENTDVLGVHLPGIASHKLNIFIFFVFLLILLTTVSVINALNGFSQDTVSRSQLLIWFYKSGYYTSMLLHSGVYKKGLVINLADAFIVKV